MYDAYHIDDADLPIASRRTARVIAERDGNVLYQRMDVPWNRNKEGEPSHPRRFFLSVADFRVRYR